MVFVLLIGLRVCCFKFAICSVAILIVYCYLVNLLEFSFGYLCCFLILTMVVVMSGCRFVMFG